METTTPTSNFRRRTTFAFDADADGNKDDETRIMDEEEQEALINDLRERSAAANHQFMLALLAFVVLSMYIHIIFFFMSFTTNPLSILLPSASTAPRAPLSRLLDLAALFVHLNIVLDLPITRESTLSIARWASSLPYLPLSQRITLVIAAALPVVAVMAGYEWQICAWHGVSVLLAGVVQAVQKWMKEGDEGIMQLESLKYDARGA